MSIKKKKGVFYTEAAYVLGIFIMALGVAFAQKADFGMSMVVAPAYILHLKISQYLTFFSFGMAEYTFQLLLIILIAVVTRKFKLTYIGSFVTALIYGFVLDGLIALLSLLPSDGVPLRVIYFIAGALCCSLAVSLFFHTYLPALAYELFVKEVSAKFGININKFKTGYDITSLLVGVVMSFAFFGMWQFNGVSYGTLILALINGFIISLFTRLLERFFDFKDKLKIRRIFE